MNILAEEYTEKYLGASATWLADTEMKSLLSIRDFTSDDQVCWFNELPHRVDYLIWGISIDDMPVGAFGLKNLTTESGEFWGYIGEKCYWGRGVGDWMVENAEVKALNLGLKLLFLKVLVHNYRALNLYFKHSYKITSMIGQEGYFMEKCLQDKSLTIIS